MQTTAITFKQQNRGLYFNVAMLKLIDLVTDSEVILRNISNENFTYNNREAYDINLAEFVLLYGATIVDSDIAEDITLLSNLAEVFSYFNHCYVYDWNGQLDSLRESVYILMCKELDLELEVED